MTYYQTHLIFGLNICSLLLNILNLTLTLTEYLRDNFEIIQDESIASRWRRERNSRLLTDSCVVLMRSMYHVYVLLWCVHIRVTVWSLLLSLPVFSQMAFIDVSQMSFIHDLGPKGLWAFSRPFCPFHAPKQQLILDKRFTNLSPIISVETMSVVSPPGKGWSISVQADTVSPAWIAVVTAKPATAGPNGVRLPPSLSFTLSLYPSLSSVFHS